MINIKGIMVQVECSSQNCKELCTAWASINNDRAVSYYLHGLPKDWVRDETPQFRYPEYKYNYYCPKCTKTTYVSKENIK